MNREIAITLKYVAVNTPLFVMMAGSAVYKHIHKVSHSLLCFSIHFFAYVISLSKLAYGSGA